MTAGEAVLDARGLLCPLPLVMAVKRLRNEPAGFRLTVLADDPAAPGDFRALAERGEICLTSVEFEGEAWRIVVERTRS